MAACDQKLTDWTKMIVEWIQYWFQIVHFVHFKISDWSSFQMWQLKEIHNFASKTGSKLFTSYVVSKYRIGHRFKCGNSKKSITSLPKLVPNCSLQTFVHDVSVEGWCMLTNSDGAQLCFKETKHLFKQKESHSIGQRTNGQNGSL